MTENEELKERVRILEERLTALENSISLFTTHTSDYIITSKEAFLRHNEEIEKLKNKGKTALFKA